MPQLGAPSGPRHPERLNRRDRIADTKGSLVETIGRAAQIGAGLGLAFLLGLAFRRMQRPNHGIG
jgi:hypothetical protein